MKIEQTQYLFFFFLEKCSDKRHLNIVLDCLSHYIRNVLFITFFRPSDLCSNFVAPLNNRQKTHFRMFVLVVSSVAVNEGV